MRVGKKITLQQRHRPAVPETLAAEPADSSGDLPASAVAVSAAVVAAIVAAAFPVLISQNMHDKCQLGLHGESYL
jgi:hypothetical protein